MVRRHDCEPSESSETISPRVTLPFNEDTSYVYEPLPVPTRMKHNKRPVPLVEDSTEYDEEASVDLHRTPTTTTRNDSATSWISRRLYTSNGWRFISSYIINPCMGVLCSSRLCRYLYQGGHFTPLGQDALQLLLAVCIFHLIPMFLYFLFDLGGLNVSFGVYVATMIFLVTMSFLLLTECLCAFGHSGPPKAPGVPETPASAIICAYLPNEADIIVETVEHFLNLEYEPGIQIILSYNTPVRIPAVEEQLEVLANRFPNLLVLRIEHSTSKAQNLNAALDFVVGDFVGVFDADHRPELHSFSRAWRWLSNGYDVVQGHSVSRNPEASWMARMMAVEAECRFTVSEPGRTTRDAMGFYYSNGFWKSPLLKRIGMAASMMAEDVDAGMMVLGEGRKIAMDPHLISLDLSTTTAFQTWNQRIRSAQGWFQVSMRHCFPLIFSPCLGFRQKLGIFLHLNVREMFPWFSSQVFTLVFYWIISDENRDLIRPLLLAYMTYLLVAGPLTAVAAYRLCHPTLRNPWWFLQYSLFNIFVYMGAKGACARMGHIKQVIGENSWRVTPRSTKPTYTARTEPNGQTPKETEVTAIGEPSMTVLTIQKVAHSTKRTMSSVLQESRARFQEELERADRSRHHFSRQEEESMMIAKHKLNHNVKRCDWLYSVTLLESMSDANLDGSESHDKGPSHEEVRIDYKNSNITDDTPSQNKRQETHWAKSKRVSTVDQRCIGSIMSESSNDSHSRGKVSVMDWSFQNMVGDYSVSVQPADYSISVFPANGSASLPPSDHSDSIRTSDVSVSETHQYKPRTTRFQKVFNLSRLLSGSVSSKETSEQSSSRNSLYSDFSRSIDEHGSGAFWTRTTNEASNADDQSNSTITEANISSHKVTEGDIEEGRGEYADVKRLAAQNEAAGTLSPKVTFNTVSSNIKKGFSLDPPSSSTAVTNTSFRPDPPLKERHGKVQKECVQSNLGGQPVKERYWKKKGRYWAANSDKPGAGAAPPRESPEQHRIGRDPEASRTPQKRRHGDAPSEVGRIYTIEESQDDQENVSDEMVGVDELCSSAHSTYLNLRCADPPAEEMHSICQRSGDVPNQAASYSPSKLSDALRPDQPSSVIPQSMIKTIPQLRVVTSTDAPAESPAESVEYPPRRDVEIYQHVMSDEEIDAGLNALGEGNEEAAVHFTNSVSTNAVSGDPSLMATDVDLKLMLEEDGTEAIENTSLLLGDTNMGSISANKSISACSLDFPSDAPIAEHNEKDEKLIILGSDAVSKSREEPPGCADLQIIEQSSSSVNMYSTEGKTDNVEEPPMYADLQVMEPSSCSISSGDHLSEKLSDVEEPFECAVSQFIEQSSHSANKSSPEKKFGFVEEPPGYADLQATELDDVEDSKDVFTASADISLGTSHGSSLDHPRVGSESKCSSSMYSCTSNADDVNQGYTTNTVDCASVDSSLYMECNDMKYRKYGKDVRDDSKPENEVIFLSESAEGNLSVNDYNENSMQTSFGEGEDFLALQQMIELEMDRENKPADSNDDEVESGSSLDNRVLQFKSTSAEDAQTQRRAFFKELSITATPDEISEGVSSKHDRSTFSNTFQQSKDVKVAKTSTGSRGSSSGSGTSTQSRTKTYLPFKPPIHIELNDEASLGGSISDADTTAHSCSQSYSVPYSGDIGAGEADEHSSADTVAAYLLAANITVLETLPKENMDPESGASVLEGPEYDAAPIAHTNGVTDDLNDASEFSRSVNSRNHNQDEYCAKEQFQKEASAVTAQPDYNAGLQSSEIPSDPPADEHIAGNIASGYGDTKSIKKPALCTNIQLSTSRSTTDEESAVSEIAENIPVTDEHSTSWIQNLLDAMDEEIIFCDALSPIEAYDDHEIPDLVESNTGQDTLQTASTQSYDEEHKTPDDWLGDEVSTVDLTVN